VQAAVPIVSMTPFGIPGQEENGKRRPIPKSALTITFSTLRDACTMPSDSQSYHAAPISTRVHLDTQRQAPSDRIRQASRATLKAPQHLCRPSNPPPRSRSAFFSARGRAITPSPFISWNIEPGSEESGANYTKIRCVICSALQPACASAVHGHQSHRPEARQAASYRTG